MVGYFTQWCRTMIYNKSNMCVVCLINHLRFIHESKKPKWPPSHLILKCIYDDKNAWGYVVYFYRFFCIGDPSQASICRFRIIPGLKSKFSSHGNGQFNIYTSRPVRYSQKGVKFSCLLQGKTLCISHFAIQWDINTLLSAHYQRIAS